MDMLDDAKLQKLKELRRILRELIAEGEGDGEMQSDDVDAVLEEAEEGEMEEPEGAAEDLPVREATEEEMGKEGEMEDELTKLKREYFKPKAPKVEPKKGVAKIVVGPGKMSMSESIPMPKRKLR